MLLHVVKRKSTEIVEYEPGKIIRAILAAMTAVLPSVGESDCKAAAIIEQNIYETITTEFTDGIVCVEDIEEMVETALMKEYPQVARAYIEYRMSHDLEREKLQSFRHNRKCNREIAEKKRFMDEYKKAHNPATGSQFDANANVEHKNIATLSGELYKKESIQLNRQLMAEKLTELYDKEIAEEYIRQLETHEIYKHDETSIFPYCVSINMYPFLLDGLKDLGGHSGPPTHLQSFAGAFINLAFAVSSQFAGAVATPEFLMYLDYFIQKDYGKDYYKRAGEVVDSSTRQRTIEKVIEDVFQQIVYSLNQPAAARNYQCVRADVTKLYTPNGYRYLHELREGDTCYVWKDGELKQEKIEKLNVYDFDGELYQFIGKEYQQTVTSGHRVVYSKSPDGELLIDTAEEFADKFIWATDSNTDYYMPTIGDKSSSVKLQTCIKVPYKGQVWCPSTNTGIVIFQEEVGIPYITGNSIFWNIGYFDSFYFDSMFGNFSFPDGQKPSWDSLNWLQKKFMKWFNKERTKAVLTFPVETLAMLTENNDIKDEEWGQFASEMYAEGHSFFTYLSDSADSLSSCCFAEDQTVVINISSKLDVFPKILSFKEIEALSETDKDNLYALSASNNGFVPCSLVKLPNDRPMYRVTIKDGRELVVTDNHIHSTTRGDVPTSELLPSDRLIDCFLLDVQGNLEFTTVSIDTIEPVVYNQRSVYCLEMKDHSDPYFVLGNGIATHNCRLRNEIQDNTFSFSLGAGGVATGSKSVITINVNRLVQNAMRTATPLKDAIETQVSKIHKYQIAFNEIMKDNLNAGLLPIYDAGFITLDKQYLTIGVNGIVEAAEFLGLDVSPNDKYFEFIAAVLRPIYEMNKKAKTKEIMFNTECVPAENLGVKHATWDKEDGYFVPRPVYNSYFYKVEDETCNILDKLKLHGRQSSDVLDGGSAAHLNLNEHLSPVQYRQLLKAAAIEGCNYFTFNIPNTVCNDCGYIDKNRRQSCQKCGSTNLDYLTRIIGYLKRVSSFSLDRQKEESKRYYA